LFYRNAAARLPLERWAIEPRGYVLCTVHRAENTDDGGRLASIWEALRAIAEDTAVIFPAHPRTRKLLVDLPPHRQIRIIEPVSYLEMVRLESDARAILTDSGGVQKEAFFQKVPCLTLRDETEWTETVDQGWNRLCGAATTRIVDAWRTLQMPASSAACPYGDGHAAEHIVRELLNNR
jgi:UDP-GlcNAc3NAcA epimerase